LGLGSAATQASTAFQAADATLTAVANTTTTANSFIYFTAPDTTAVSAITAFGRSLIDDTDAAAARTSLGLGSASTAAVMTSLTDTNTGRLMPVGAFGVGAALDIRPIYTAQFSTPQLCYGKGVVKGLMRADALGITAFTGAAVGVLTIEGTWTDVTAITAIRQRWSNGNYTAERFGSSATTWTDWRVAYNNGNILGTVSQSAGVPTGAIIERGGNANGEFVRFADGTQICTHSLALTSVSVSANDQVTVLSSATFPAAFIATPAVDVSHIGGFSARYNVGVEGVTATSWCSGTGVAFRNLDNTTRSVTPVLALSAIGRWR
jgi:hypothetical protein